MVFNSIQFVIFFVLFFLLYWIIFGKRQKWQNVVLLVANYVFYGIAEWRMIPLLLFMTLAFYWLGIAIRSAKKEENSRRLTLVGIVLGVGTLLYFKYFNFFIESFSSLFNAIGLHTNWHTFNILMPLGVSYFTFKLISYVIEVRDENVEVCRDIVSFANYVAFFPTIMSGPIDRPTFISQLQKKREFNYDQAVDGMRQILWGLFKKVVVADNCATYVNSVWSNIDGSTGSTLLLAAVLFTFQIYADFSGYSDMAIGIGKVMGFNVTKNFNFPFFSLNIADFWRRWHMSLTTWLTDYVFTPLNFMFRSKGRFGIILAILINMVLVGLWHGANWTYVCFGLYHGLLFIPLIYSGAFQKKQEIRVNRIGLPRLGDALKMLLTFGLVVIGSIITRSESIGQAWEYVCGMMQFGTIRALYRFFILDKIRKPVIAILIMMIVEWFGRKGDYTLAGIENVAVLRNKWCRIVLYAVFIVMIFSFRGGLHEFIYFHF